MLAALCTPVQPDPTRRGGVAGGEVWPLTEEAVPVCATTGGAVAAASAAAKPTFLFPLATGPRPQGRNLQNAQNERHIANIAIIKSKGRGGPHNLVPKNMSAACSALPPAGQASLHVTPAAATCAATAAVAVAAAAAAAAAAAPASAAPASAAPASAAAAAAAAAPRLGLSSWCPPPLPG